MIGPGIQGNKYNLKFVTLRVFNVLNLTTSRLIDFEVMQSEVLKLGLESVPFINTIKLDHTIDALVAMAVGVSVLNSKTEREGLVLRPMIEESDLDIGGRLSFKAISPKFLLKFDE